MLFFWGPWNGKPLHSFDFSVSFSFLFHACRLVLLLLSDLKYLWPCCWAVSQFYWGWLKFEVWRNSQYLWIHFNKWVYILGKRVQWDHLNPIARVGLVGKLCVAFFSWCRVCHCCMFLWKWWCPSIMVKVSGYLLLSSVQAMSSWKELLFSWMRWKNTPISFTFNKTSSLLLNVAFNTNFHPGSETPGTL